SIALRNPASAPGTAVTPRSGTGSPASGSAGSAGGSTSPGAQMYVRFDTFFHPFACAFIKEVNRYGLPALLTLGSQAMTNDNGVIAGFTLATNWRKATPKLSPGLLIAQGKLYESTTVPDPNLGP